MFFVASVLMFDPLRVTYLDGWFFVALGLTNNYWLVHIPKGYWTYTDTILTKIIVVGTDGIKLVLYKNQYWIYTDHIPKPNWILDQNRQI